MGFQSAFNQALGSFAALGVYRGVKQTIKKEGEELRGAIAAIGEPSEEEKAKAQAHTEALQEEHNAQSYIQEGLKKAGAAGGPREESAFGGESLAVFSDPKTQAALESYTDVVKRKAIQNAGFEERKTMLKQMKDEGIVSGKKYKEYIYKMRGSK